MGSVLVCSHFGSKPALPLLPVRFLAHPAEKARTGPNSLAVPDFTLLVVLTPRGAWQIRAQGTGTAASLVYFSLHNGVCGSQGTATQRQPCGCRHHRQQLNPVEITNPGSLTGILKVTLCFLGSWLSIRRHIHGCHPSSLVMDL